MAGSGGAARIEIEQFRGGIARAFRRAAPGAIPLAAAEPGEWRVVGIRAEIARQTIERRDRHVQLVAAGVFEQHEFDDVAVHLAGDESPKATDAVILMHDRRTFREIGEVADNGCGIACGAFPASGRRGARAEDGRVRYHGEIRFGQHEAAFEFGNGERKARAPIPKRLPAPDQFGLESAPGEHFAHGFTPTRRFGGEKQ